MSSSEAGPWKKAANHSAIRREADTRSFPPLSAKSQTKKQSRLRALYTQTPNFNPYTPRQEQLNRQELERLQTVCDDSDGVLTSLEPQNDDNSILGAAAQRNGISSVSFKDKHSQRQARGADSKKKGKQSKDAADLSHHNHSNSGQLHSSSPRDLPQAFTDARIESLLAECQRRQVLAAAQQRIDSEAASSETFHQPFTGELSKAFASLDGFLAAFGEEIGDPSKEHIITKNT